MLDEARTPPPKPGIYRDIPFEEYAAWDCFHKSDVSALLRSPMHWKDDQDNFRATEDMDFGSLVDAMLLEPPVVEQRFIARPATYFTEETHGRGAEKTTTTIEKPWTAQSNHCKAWLQDAAAAGKVVLPATDFARARNAAAAARAHPMLADCLSRGSFQVSMVWIDEDPESHQQTPCKARIDILLEPGELMGLDLGAIDMAIVDLKLTNNADRNPFRRTLTNYGYHIQGGLYVEGYSILSGGVKPPFYLAAVESEKPHGVAVYPLGADSLMSGLKRARQAMAIWRDCRASGVYYGYSTMQDEINAMPWALDKELEVNV